MSRLHEEKAQGVIEFALLATIMMFLFLGTVDFSRFLYYSQAISGAARAGAESATNHCSSRTNCTKDTAMVGDDVILHATVCAAQPYVTIYPAVNSCATPCDTGTCSTSCPNTATSCCLNDVCISPSYANRLSGTAVEVDVGYNFRPMTPLIAPFFHSGTCFSQSSGSESTHTLCATAYGRVK